MSIDLSGADAPTGYAAADTYYGVRFMQGGRVNYLLDLTPVQLISLVPRPNPEKPLPGNRRIIAKHASDFAVYQRATPEWVVPGILLHVEKPLKFKLQTPDEWPVKFGAITFPRAAQTGFQIVDGQHRILGFIEALESIAAEKAKYQDALLKARRQEAGGEVELNDKLLLLDKQLARLTDEHVAVQIIVESDPAKNRQMFYDIAENAKGITASVRARFDSRKAINRALEKVLNHSLLQGRVDAEGDRLKRNSPYYLTAKYVIEMMRAATVGYEGRIGVRIEKKLNDADIERNVTDFLDALVEQFPILTNLQMGAITPQQVRDRSLLGGHVFVRILAALWHDLQEDSAWTPAMLKDFYGKLAPHTLGPIHEGHILWKEVGEPSFQIGSNVVSTRRQDALAVLAKLKEWAVESIEGKTPLDAKPADPPPAPSAAELPEPTEEEVEEILRPETTRARRERATKKKTA